jgi:hypothetical protein
MEYAVAYERRTDAFGTYFSQYATKRMQHYQINLQLQIIPSIHRIPSVILNTRCFEQFCVTLVHSSRCHCPDHRGKGYDNVYSSKRWGG